MQRGFTSRTATKVKDGRVLPKNRNQPTTHKGYVFDRESPGRGFKHVVSKADIQAFVELLPEWDRYSERLERIVWLRPVTTVMACMNSSTGRRQARFTSTLGPKIFGLRWLCPTLKLTDTSLIGWESVMMLRRHLLDVTSQNRWRVLSASFMCSCTSWDITLIVYIRSTWVQRRARTMRSDLQTADLRLFSLLM